MVLRRLIFPLIWGGAGCGVYYALNHWKLNALAPPMNMFYGDQFFAVLATLYAIMTALVLIKGLETVDALSAAVLKEATKLGAIASLSAAFKDDAARGAMRNLRGELLIYVENLRSQGAAARMRRNDGVIEGCRRIVASLTTEDAFETGLRLEILRELESLRLLRAERGALAEARLPSYLIWMLAMMTLAILAPFFLDYAEGASFNYYVIFTLSTFGSFIFFMMQDINRPYEGLWKVDVTPFDDAADALSGVGG